jgi:starch synthase
VYAAANDSPTVAILPWGHVIEDFLEPEGLSLDEFADAFRGSWMFGYADALATAGVRTAIVLISARATGLERRVHLPTAASISVLPAPPAFKALRRRAANLYARRADEAFATASGHVSRLARRGAHSAAPYIPTPLRALVRELRALDVSTLLSQEYERPGFDVAVADGALARIPVAASFQGGDYRRLQVEALTRPLSVRRASALIVPTAGEAARVRRVYGVPEERVHRIFNPVDTATWRPGDRHGARSSLAIPEDAPVVAWHGRVAIRQKGLDVLLEAWRRVERDWEGESRPRLLLVGGGRDSEAVDLLARQLRLEGLVRVSRHLHCARELAGLLAAGDLYALPSRHEGFPVALLEALACGLPAVAAEANGVRDILEGDGEPLGTVVPRDDADALAAALGSLLRDRARRASMGAAARATAERRFSSEAIGQRLREVLC